MSIQDEVIETTDDPCRDRLRDMRKAWLWTSPLRDVAHGKQTTPKTLPRDLQRYPLRTLPTSLSWEGLQLSEQRGWLPFL